jgi:hypothetical protein
MTLFADIVFNSGAAYRLRYGRADPNPVYANRVLATEPTRIHIDAKTTMEWREKGFYPVLNERAPTPEAKRLSESASIQV